MTRTAQDIAPLATALETFARKNAVKLAFIDGRFAPELSDDPKALPALDVSRGLVLGITADAPMPPLQVFWSATGAAQNPCARDIVLENGAAAEIDEFHLGAKGESAATVLRVGEEARLTHRRFQLEAPSAEGAAASTRAEILARGRFESLHFTFGAARQSHDLNVRLLGEGAHAELNALYAVKAGLEARHDTVVEHASPGTVSRQTYKGVIRDGGRAAFNGKILIGRGAKGSDAAQLNKNLLLGRAARADTKPQLEINNDDVKCSHGAAVGQVSAEELFYLQSRGIPEQEALAMLIRGFAADIIDKIAASDLRSALRKLLFDDFFSDGGAP